MDSNISPLQQIDPSQIGIEVISIEEDKSEEKIFQLNVRGVTLGFLLGKKTLCAVPGSKLETFFSDTNLIASKDGVVFIDRDPKYFSMLINFLTYFEEFDFDVLNKHEQRCFLKEMKEWDVDYFWILNNIWENESREENRDDESMVRSELKKVRSDYKPKKEDVESE